MSGQVAKWVVKIFELNIKFQPWSSIKVQILTNFLVECTIPDKPTEADEAKPLEQASSPIKNPINAYKVYMDGSSSPIGSGARLVFVGPEGVVVEHALCFEFPAINNETKYEVLITGL